MTVSGLRRDGKSSLIVDRQCKLSISIMRFMRFF